MKSHTMILTAVMIAAALIGAMLAGILNAAHNELRPELAELTPLPIGGMHKFASDVDWMLFVNYVGSQNEINESNVDEVIARLERLIKLDPNLDRLYSEGVAMIAFADPRRTAEMLKKACDNPHLAQNAGIPFYTGFVLVHNLKPADHAEALKYFKLAIDRCTDPEGIGQQYRSYYYRSRAKLLAAAEKMDEKLALVEVLYNELRNYAGERFVGELNHLRTRLFHAIQLIKQPDEDYTPSKATIDRVNHIAGKAFSGERLCGECLTPVGPGQSFCGCCGKPVQLWGTCAKCAKVVCNTAYCPFCGTKSAR